MFSFFELNTVPDASVPGSFVPVGVETLTVAVAARIERGVYDKCFARDTTESRRTALSRNISFETIFA